MSAPITFSGFNNIDFNQILNAIMQQARAPLTALEDRQKALKSQITTFDTLAANVSALRAAADDLGDLSSLQTIAGASSDDAVSVFVSRDNGTFLRGAHDVSVLLGDGVGVDHHRHRTIDLRRQLRIHYSCGKRVRRTLLKPAPGCSEFFRKFNEPICILLKGRFLRQIIYERLNLISIKSKIEG